jgi:hypothetical protein
MEGGILSWLAMMATAATTASSTTRTWIVEVIGAAKLLVLAGHRHA